MFKQIFVLKQIFPKIYNDHQPRLFTYWTVIHHPISFIFSIKKYYLYYSNNIMEKLIL